MKTLAILLLSMLFISIVTVAQKGKPSGSASSGAVNAAKNTGSSLTEPASGAQQGEVRPASSNAAIAGHEMTDADVSAFIDGILPQQLQQDDIAGATVVVVKDGKVLFTKGYGYADVAKKTPVSPDTTLFRCGSVSKLFTWTAVMQLQEQGKLDLDRDVNDYLDFKIPYRFGKPITMRNLLTHTPGFEDTAKDLFALGTGNVDLRGYLTNHIPTQIFPPGTIPAYSNYGAALAGYIVQRISGVPFEKYIEDNIFKPLGMTHSSFAQPLPKDLAPLMSSGYMRASEDAKPFEVVTPFPAGSLASSAGDMARFIIAQLQDGQFQDARILRPETVKLMHTRQFGLDPELHGIACGFYEESRNGHRIIGHGGDTVYFHSDLHLIPDANVGFFVSYNSAGRGQGSPREQLWYAFLDRYFPYTPPTEPTAATAKADAHVVAGSYIVSRRNDTSFLKSLYLLSEFTVSAKADSTIQVDQLEGFNGQPKTWREIGPLRYREVDGQDMIVFKRDQNGRLLLATDIPIFAGQRVGLFENQDFVLPVVLIALVIMLLTLVLWPIGGLIRRHYGKQLAFNGPEKRLRVVTRLILTLDLVFIAGLGGIIAYGFTHLWVLNDRLDTWIHLAQVIGVIGVVGTLAVLMNAFVGWASPRKGIWTKIGDTAVLLACIMFAWFAYSAHLLNFALRY